MAKTSRSTTTKKAPKRSKAADRKTKKETELERKHKNQLRAIILFSLGLLVTALTFIRGQNVWEFLHKGLFGIFGVPTLFVGPMILLIAILSAKERTGQPLKHKIWQVGILFLFICAEVQILGAETTLGSDFGAQIVLLYQNGAAMHGGGVAGGLVGLPLLHLLGKTGAAVLVGIVIFTLALILTGTTLIGFFRGMAKPVKKMEEGYVQHRAAVLEERQKKFDVDVDLGPDPLPGHPVWSRKRFFIPNPDAPVAEPLKPETTSEPEETGSLSAEPAVVIDDLVKKVTEPEPAPASAEPEPVPLANRTDESGEQPYRHPPVSLLKAPVHKVNRDISGELRANADLLVDTLKSFGVETRIIDISRGPSVTRYELQPSAGVKISKITSLADDIALNLAASGVRIEAPIPNKAAVGIEVPNRKTDMVPLREIIDSSAFQNARSPLSFAVGKDIAGNVVVEDIERMPHMLIAGATGSGKSVCMNSMIVSLLYKSSPDEVRMLMVDPKMVELVGYNGIPHLLVPVVTDPKKAAGTLGWAVNEMAKRYNLFAESGVRDIKGHNRAAAANEELDALPRIVIFIDELADLMMTSSNQVEDHICRLAQMGRAAGIHLVIATQRPSVDVITGLIKANIGSRIALAVSSQVDSRTILDTGGAEKLLGHGDMLFHRFGSPKPTRIQGCYVSDSEVEQVVSFIKAQVDADYSDEILEEIERRAAAENGSSSSGGGLDDQDPMLAAAIECVVEAGQASTSFLQRRLKLGYARAARIMDDMHERGIVGPQEGSKARQVLITKQQWQEMALRQEQDASPTA